MNFNGQTGWNSINWTEFSQINQINYKKRWNNYTATKAHFVKLCQLQHSVAVYLINVLLISKVASYTLKQVMLCFSLTYLSCCIDHCEVTKTWVHFPNCNHSWHPFVEQEVDASKNQQLGHKTGRTSVWFFSCFPWRQFDLGLDDLLLQSTNYILYHFSQIQAESMWWEHILHQNAEHSSLVSDLHEDQCIVIKYQSHTRHVSTVQ